MRPVLLSALLALAALAGLAWAADDPGAPAPAAPTAAAPDADGPDWTASWSAGTPAASAARALTPIAPIPVLVPEAVAAKVTGDTALFYFSPTCPHCQAVMPEVRAAAARGRLTWVGVASGSATADQVARFKEEYGADFDILIDTDHAFAQSLGARSTPTLYLARPTTTEAPAENAAYVEGGSKVELFEAYAPLGRGMVSIVELRTHLDAPYTAFGGSYQGDRVCGLCHEQEALSWATTHHAVAYRTLYTQDRATDLACVRCHVTGLDQPGGFAVGDHSSALTDVTCEACHGPGGPHDGTPADATQACQGCHDAEHSINFSLEKGLPLIDHYRANGMDEAALRQRLQDLASGQAERPLLAFAEGPTVGAQACKGCHKVQHKWWKKAEHANAMASLQGEETQDPACLRCHATPVALSAAGLPAGEGVSAFRVDEGVGCESCHGPGARHAQTQASDDIVGLGESCPECVIEAVCTSCHVPKWDPTWELKGRLRAVEH